MSFNLFWLTFLFQEHRKVHVDKQPWLCRECPLIFDYSGKLAKHVRDDHGFVVDADIFCIFCRQLFESTSALIEHNDEAHPDVKFCCRICGKGIVRRCLLRKHLMTSHRHDNDVCDKLLLSWGVEDEDDDA